jgi:hypothetical protein
LEPEMLSRLEHLPNNPSNLWFPIIRASKAITINVSSVLEEYRYDCSYLHITYLMYCALSRTFLWVILSLYFLCYYAMKNIMNHI